MASVKKVTKTMAVEALNAYSKAELALEDHAKRREEELLALMPKDVRAMYLLRSQELTSIGEVLAATVEEQKAEVARMVLDLGETVKAETAMGIYCQGKESWDGKGLAGYAIANPEVLAFRTIGAPYTQIRKVAKAAEK